MKQNFIKVYRKGFLVFCVMVIGLFSSCARILPEQIVTRKIPVSMTVDKTTGGEIRTLSSAWNGNIFTASVEQDEVCFKQHKEGYVEQDFREKEVKGYGAPLGVGLGFVAGGAVAVGVGAEYDNNAAAISVGSLALAFGLGEMIYGAAMAAKGSSFKVGPATEYVTWGPREKVHVCGLYERPGGRLFVKVGERTFYNQPAVGDRISVDISPLMQSICNSEELLGYPLTVEFDANSVRTVLSTMSVEKCIRRSVSGNLYKDAYIRSNASKEPSNLLLVSNLLDHAEDLAQPLPEGDKVREQRLKDIWDLRLSVRMELKSELKKLLISFRANAKKKDHVKLASAGPLILDYARALKDVQLDVWTEVYQAVISAATVDSLGSVESVKTLLNGDVESRSCIENEARCPAWMKRKALLDLLEPYLNSVRVELNGSRDGLVAASDELRQEITLRRGNAIKKQLKSSAVAQRKACDLSVWDDGINQACSGIRASIKDGKHVLAVSKDTLFQLELEYTAQQWREHARRCRDVSAAWLKNRAMSPCGAACQNERRSLVKQNQALYNTPKGPLSNTTKREILEICRDARCPRCPE